jgi:hypothetical protein
MHRLWHRLDKKEPRWLVAVEAMRVESFRISKHSRFWLKIGNGQEHRAVARNSPPAEVEIGRPDAAANRIDDGA